MLPVGQRTERGVTAAGGEQRTDHVRGERRAAVGDPPHRVEEVVNLQDPVLEQVPEAAGGDERHGVPGLDVLGQQHHWQVRMPLPQRHGGAGHRRRSWWAACATSPMCVRCWWIYAIEAGL
jgi:hypothetical protein